MIKGFYTNEDLKEYGYCDPREILKFHCFDVNLPVEEDKKSNFLSFERNNKIILEDISILKNDLLDLCQDSSSALDVFLQSINTKLVRSVICNHSTTSISDLLLKFMDCYSIKFNDLTNLNSEVFRSQKTYVISFSFTHFEKALHFMFETEGVVINNHIFAAYLTVEDGVSSSLSNVSKDSDFFESTAQVRKLSALACPFIPPDIKQSKVIKPDIKL